MDTATTARSMLAGMLLVGVFFSSPAAADSLPDGPYISTSATAIEEIQPDYAVIELNFRTISPNMEAARAAVDAAQRKLIDVLEPYRQALGDWSLESLRFGEHWEYDRQQMQRDRAGFFGEFSVALKVLDFETLPRLHYALAGLEWQSLGNPSFDVEDPAAAEAAARRQALEQASERARDLARAGGARLGSIWGIINEPMHELAGDGAFASEAAGDSPRMLGAATAEEGSFALPMEPRPVRFKARVGVVYLLAPVAQ